MKHIYIIAFFSLLLFSFYSHQSKKEPQFVIAFVQDKYLNNISDINNAKTKSNFVTNNGIVTENFIGIFPKKNDTVSIYKLNENLHEKPEKFSFWSKKNNDKSITFYSSDQNELNVTFTNHNNIIVNNDTYTVNDDYYNFLRQKICDKQSILDLAFFLKDGYGDYAQELEPLNKNWRNQKDNNVFRIIKAKIKNRDFQTDNQFFTYKIDYNYTKNGSLQSISGENSFNKKLIKQNKKYIIYCINRSINERASDSEYLYKNKKTLFDSIVGTREKFSSATTSHYIEYQSKLKFESVDEKPKNINQILKILKLNKKELD